MEGGRSDGMRAVDINNGTGLEFTILADRAMDIGRLAKNSVNMSYITKAGYVAPSYEDDKGIGWLKIFSGGFLTPCGLTQVGSPCEVSSEHLGLHGQISTAPAEEFCVRIDFEKSLPEIIVSGRMRLGKLFGNNIWLSRTYRIKCGENSIHIEDKVENRDESKN